MDPFAKRTLSHYQILEKLGEGGMGVVYKARDTRLNRLAAVKILPPDKMTDPARRARFIQEAQTASALNHPNIVTIYEIDHTEDVDFIAMELIPGVTLDRAIGRGLKLAPLLKYSIQIADALGAAHRAGIVHRDLKPSNVMVTESGVVKVLDFGLAKLTESSLPVDGATRTEHDAPLTEQGTIMGTASYMSPEQAEGRPVDARSDIFSFGSLLYEMVTGQRAFRGETKISVLSAILRDDPKPLSESGDPVPRDLEKIVLRCLRKDPARRFQHVDDVKIALEELKDESDSGRLSAAVPSAAPSAKRRPVSLYVGLAVAGVGLAAGAWFFLQSRQQAVPASALSLRPLTQNPGITRFPSISPDGKLIAYSSTRGDDGSVSVWVQQLSAGAQPIRLTHHKSRALAPSFSPDGGQIVFESNREGGGIYTVPSLGGEERLVLRGNLHNPRFSPDGRWIVADTTGFFASNLLVVPASGGEPRRIAENFYSPKAGVWSPDGKVILFYGQQDQRSDPDWWAIPLEGGTPQSTGAAKAFAASGLRAGIQLPWPADWLDDYVLFSGGNLGRIVISRRTLQVEGKPERLTTSSANEQDPRAVAKPGGRPGTWSIVFATINASEGLWSLSMNLNAAKISGEAVKLFSDGVERVSPALSADGSRMSYVFGELDSYGVRVRDVKNGTETTLLHSPGFVRARLSPDGSTLAYNMAGNNERNTVIYLASAAGGNARKFCDSCGLLYEWSPDGKKVLYRTGDPMRFYTVDTSTGQKTLIVGHPKHRIHGVRYSPDGRWIVMHYGPGLDAPRTLFIMPSRDGQAGPESEWIPIMDRPGLHVRPWWSPDGNRIYFLSDTGGSESIWTQRLDPASKRPMGEPELVYRPQTERLRIGNHTFFGPAEGRDQLIFPMRESSGNVWIAE